MLQSFSPANAKVEKPMRYLRPLASILFGLFLINGAGSGPVPRATPVPQDNTQKKEIRVWVNTNSGIYHCPGTRWYGATKQGKYMGECEALKAGYRAAYYRACGTDCKK
jgi:hypothetical protein